MARSMDSCNSLASPTASTSSAAPSPCSSYASSTSPLSSMSSSGSIAPSSSSNKSVRSRNSDKSLGLKSASSIDRRKRLAANARERKRMHLLNKAYDQLRQRLVDAENKSKYDVLVQAKEYIQALATICEKFDRENPRPQQPQLQQSQQQLHHLHRQPPISPTQSTTSPHAATLETAHCIYLDASCKTENSPMDMSYKTTTDHSPYIVNSSLGQTTQ